MILIWNGCGVVFVVMPTHARSNRGRICSSIAAKLTKHVADIHAPAQLLAMLQARRDWSGRELASRLEVSTRTIRTDIERLRDLGYPVEATPGVGGGYRLGHGTTMPPLLLDDEEVVAVAVGLRTTTSAGITGIEETSLRALVKLEQLMPSRLRHRIDALRTATVSVSGTGPTVESGRVER